MSKYAEDELMDLELSCFDLLVHRAGQQPAIPVAGFYPLTQVALARALDAAVDMRRYFRGNSSLPACASFR